MRSEEIRDALRTLRELAGTKNARRRALALIRRATKHAGERKGLEDHFDTWEARYRQPSLPLPFARSSSSDSEDE